HVLNVEKHRVAVFGAISQAGEHQQRRGGGMAVGGGGWRHYAARTTWAGGMIGPLSPPLNPSTEHRSVVSGASFALTYSSPSGPIAVTCVTYSPDLAQWKWEVLPGSTITAPAG